MIRSAKRLRDQIQTQQLELRSVTAQIVAIVCACVYTYKTLSELFGKICSGVCTEEPEGACPQNFGTLLDYSHLSYAGMQLISWLKKRKFLKASKFLSFFLFFLGGGG